ncbi:FecR domain-containing protein [Pedobacter sp. MC2016-05]|uniref:FecR family protein n=1 Tax=Pedobacter sp. MC2016-05 TaxID=2994474 RepID=UPI002246A42D|nr:FecR domain-containing protein [Pedobacter sp. MC2016-05]MCX2475384.1 FecR domain-containing protein [Pedobacter sp. MC2016-05]
MNKKDYLNSKTIDFLEDSNFIRLIKYQYAEDVAFWEQLLDEYPEARPFFNSASIQLKLILSANDIIAPTGLKDRLWSEIKASNLANNNATRLRKRIYYWSSGIAALFAITAYISWFMLSSITVRTAYGESKKLSLPDGSQIVLNANSTLRYPRAYAWKKLRQISLEGEAYFKVVHLNHNHDEIRQGELFRASTGTAQVEVLGTEFNLKERRGLTTVALVKGSVQVRSLKTGISYLMKEGNVVEVDSTKGEISTAQISASQFASWKEGKLIVNHTSVNEIIQAFEDLYGYKVILDNPTLGQKKIGGSISIKSEQSLLFTLSNILNVNVKKEGKTIRLESRR